MADYVSRLKDVPQGWKWHPEGDVLVHTKIVFNRALDTADPDIIMSAFFHDLGKVDTTEKRDGGGWTSPGHEDVSARLVHRYRDWVKYHGADPEAVYWIVKNHMKVKFDMGSKKTKQLKAWDWYPKLERFSECDTMKTLTLFEVLRADGNPFRFLWNRLRKSVLSA